MKWTCVVLLSLFAISAAQSGHAPQTTSATHNFHFWQSIAKNKYTVPPGESASLLSRELSANLSSPDPVLRDDLSYSILYVWIVRKELLSPGDLGFLLTEWQSNLHIAIGETGTDTIFRRSFSALCLAAIAERDLKTPFLTETRFRQLLSNALDYLNAEQDLRGFDTVKGWIHSTAHTADLLAALAKNPLFTVHHQQNLLAAVATRLSTASLIYSYGEQDRLAMTVAAIIRRPDLDAPSFHAWLAKLDETDQHVWNDAPPNLDRLKTFQNNTYFLEALAARLSAQPKSAATTTVLEQLSQILSHR